MTNVAFYLPNKNTKNVDCSGIFDGNPGIGGTECAMLLLTCSLGLNYPDLHTIVYVDEEASFPAMLTTKKVADWPDLVQKTMDDNIHIYEI
jgi:hypothetical protein